MDVDVAVVGRGMIGAAAARHLAENGINTALIGPGEPADRRTSDGPFCSHPDEGRITRIAGRTAIWSELAARSIARYGDIAERSGIEFHTARGLASVGPDAEKWVANSQSFGGDAQMVHRDWLAKATGIVIDSGHPIVFEGAPAGHINPRRLVRAQTALAQRAGAQVVEHAAAAVNRTNGGFAIGGVWGTLTAQRVLVATGAFGGSLLPRELALGRWPRTVVLAEMADPGNIPSLIVIDPPDERLEEIYWVPPVLFPDGRLCLKIGGQLGTKPAITEAGLVDWFRSDGSEVEAAALENSLRTLLPNAEIRSVTSTPCVVTGTLGEYPYIGPVADGLAVAIGGNGSAAKSSDELGRLAAGLFSDDGWTDELEASTFTPRFRS